MSKNESVTDEGTHSEGDDHDVESGVAKCPICFVYFASEIIETHVNHCIESNMSASSSNEASGDTRKKKLKIDPQAWGCLARSMDSTLSRRQSQTAEKVLSSSPSSIKTMEKGNAKSPSSSRQTPGKQPMEENKYVNSKMQDDYLPLAEKMRPNTLEEFLGQDSVVGRSTVLRNLLNNNDIPSMVMWGPPGCGKTSLVHVIAKSCKKMQSHKFHSLSATSSGVSDVKKMIEAAKTNQKMFKVKTILFIDEIHRFNKLQQDTFLPHIENGTIVLLGATTENPSFALNNALLSRCKVLKLEKLSSEDLQTILTSALNYLKISVCAATSDISSNSHNGSGITIEPDALKILAVISDGDARTALNTLEISVQAKKSSCKKLFDVNMNEENIKVSSQNTCQRISVEDIKKSLLSRQYFYDRSGDSHYDCISAFIKSMRGSDANAALYWMCRMIYGGEDPKFIARRMVIFASEDVGLADPQALVLAVSTYQSCQFIGIPECGIILAECAVYLSKASKSIESYKAYSSAMSFVKNFDGPQPGVPLHLRNAPTPLMKNMGYGKGYIYTPEDTANQKQSYLPENLSNFNCFQD